MISTKGQEIARRGQAIFDERLRTQLEKTHRDFFIAIEPDSGDYFLGRTLDEAIGTGRKAHPDRLFYALRIGHPTALEIGSAHANRQSG